eukprot:COSAG02_NODE_550_length_20437_cov_4.270676_18_plen_85_part_00
MNSSQYPVDFEKIFRLAGIRRLESFEGTSAAAMFDSSRTPYTRYDRRSKLVDTWTTTRARVAPARPGYHNVILRSGCTNDRFYP